MRDEEMRRLYDERGVPEFYGKQDSSSQRQVGREARGFSDGSLQVVNEQGKTQARQRDAPPIR